MTIILSLLVGMLGYGMDRPIKRWFDGDRDTSELASWTFGGLLLLIAFIFISMESMSKEERIKAILTLCGALVGVGSGVTILSQRSCSVPCVSSRPGLRQRDNLA